MEEEAKKPMDELNNENSGSAAQEETANQQTDSTGTPNPENPRIKDSNYFNKLEGNNYGGMSVVGAIAIVLGLALLLRNFNFLPDWLFQWHTYLIVIGIFVGTRTNFRSNGWFIMVLIGVFFTLNEIADQYEFSSEFSFPILLLLLGFFLIVRPKQDFNWRKRHRKLDATDQSVGNTNFVDDEKLNRNPADYVTAVNIFGASQQIIYTKKLNGGELTSVFGGGDVNFSQADFDGEVVLYTNAVFGGIKLIIPPQWQIRSEVTAIFGGVEDKRGVLPVDQNPNKTIILRGAVLFGGLEIKSF